MSITTVLAFLGILTLGACATGEDGGGASASACDSLRDCCKKMDELAKETCLQYADTQQAASNGEQLCQQTVDAYEQNGMCASGAGGSSGGGGSAGGTAGGTAGAATGGAGGTGGTGGTGGSGGTGGTGTGGTGGSGGTGGTGTGGTAGTGGSVNTCIHDECTTGDALDSTCSSCASTVCADDPFCCDNNWNSFCVDGARDLCGLCGTVDPCSHDECTTGTALDASCSSCVATVCDNDPYCCSTSWNGYCVEGAQTHCGLCN